MYCSTSLFPALSVSSRTRLLKISHVAAKIIGLPTPKLSAILKKARAVAAESDHTLFTLCSFSSVSKQISLNKMQKGLLQQEFHTCGNWNVK